MRSIRDIALHNQTVFLRVDFNVPLNDAGEITDDTRIKGALTTIEYLMQKGAKVVIGSHLGRPKGKVVDSMRMRPVAHRLHELLGVTVHTVDDCVGPHVEQAKKALKHGEVLLLENLRFYEQEEQNDSHFAEQLAQGIDVYIMDLRGWKDLGETTFQQAECLWNESEQVTWENIGLFVSSLITTPFISICITPSFASSSCVCIS